MIVPIPYVHAGIGLFAIVISIPLAMRKVPMNRVYGIRIRRAFLSQRHWYEINAYGGRLFVAFGIFVIFFSSNQ